MTVLKYEYSARRYLMKVSMASELMQTRSDPTLTASVRQDSLMPTCTTARERPKEFPEPFVFERRTPEFSGSTRTFEQARLQL